MRFATATAASLIFPFAPHLGSEVFERLTRRAGLGAALAARPTRRCCVSDTVTLVVQVNGKLRDRIEAAGRGLRRRSCWRWRGRARRSARHLDGKEVVKEIVVPGKLVNLVVR